VLVVVVVLVVLVLVVLRVQVSEIPSSRHACVSPSLREIVSKAKAVPSPTPSKNFFSTVTPVVVLPVGVPVAVLVVVLVAVLVVVLLLPQQQLLLWLGLRIPRNHLRVSLHRRREKLRSKMLSDGKLLRLRSPHRRHSRRPLGRQPDCKPEAKGKRGNREPSAN
jgi:hypothetical protein